MYGELNRLCPFCGKKLKSDGYRMEKGRIEFCAYCDNCNQFCTDSTLPSRVLEELKCLNQLTLKIQEEKYGSKHYF